MDSSSSRTLDSRIETSAESAGVREIAFALFVALRCHQWSKNLLILIPVVTSHTYHQPMIVLAGLALVAAWSLVASGSYLINDLLDLEADRSDPIKCNRPIASGRLPVAVARTAAPILIFAGLGVALVVSVEAALIVLLYAAVVQLYSTFIKKHLLVDVFTLAFLYTIRVVGGGIATGNHVTIWLLAFASFLFLGLAILKRCAELIRLQEDGGELAVNRAYRVSDLPLLQTFGVASSFLSVLVLSLYVDSHVAQNTYARPQLLWAIVPLMLLWLCRLWMKTTRGEMHHDPIVFSLRDRGSWLIGLATVAAIGLAVA